MWDIPRYRIRAYVQSLRRARKLKEIRPRSPIHLKRTRASVMIGDGFAAQADVVQCRVVLNDLTPKGVYLYSAVPLSQGATISITLEWPKFLYVRGKVLTCHQRSEQVRVLSLYPLTYRIAIEFKFDSFSEKNALYEYCASDLAQFLYGGAVTN